MSQFNFPGNATTVSLLSAVSAANTAAATGAAGTDLIEYEGPIVITQNHGISTGTLAGKIQDSADNSAFADVAGLTFTGETTTVGVQQLVVQSKQVRRYIKYVGTVVTGPQVLAVTMTGVKKSV
jgi:delta 1-pyrroline-5-carboxylate dehydrogenase